MKQFLSKYFHYIFVVVFSIISASTLFMCCDDYIWYFAFTDEKIASYSSPNGRYLTNLIVRYGVQNRVLFAVFYVISFSLMIFLMMKLLKNRKVPESVSCFAIFTLIHFIPSKTYTEVFRWISGFPNYCFAFIFTLIYLLFVLKLISSEKDPKPITSVLFLILGVAGALCVEHLAIYNICLSVFAVIYCLAKRKKLYLHNVLFLIGSVVGLIIMLSHKEYSVISNEKDNLGVRNFEFSFVEILFHVYRFIVPNYSNNFIPVHIILAASFTYLYCRSVEAKKSKYSLPCVFICWFYVIFSSFTFMFEDLALLSGAMKSRSIELSILFLYVCAISYNVFTYIHGIARLRSFLFFFSTIFLIAPFVIVSPVTARVFFVEYMFWILFALEVAYYAFSDTKLFTSPMLSRVVMTFSCALFVLFSNMDITNCYYDNVRFSYIQEQFAEGRKKIDLIILPYQKNAYDDLSDEEAFDGVLNNDITHEQDITYIEYIMKYYGISYDEYIDKKFVEISAYDYNTLMESE